MKILVTGSAGFIGHHLTKKLLERGDEVIGFDNINDYYDVNLKFGRLNEVGILRSEIKKGKLIGSKAFNNYRFVQEDLENGDFLNNLFNHEKFDIVVNMAAQPGVRYSLINPHAYISSNVTGFLNILEACRHTPVKHLVYASSSSVYGANTSMPFSTKDSVDNPVSLYAASKKSNELMAHTYSHLFNIPTTGLRFFTVYGPWGRPDMALFIFTKKILNGEPIPIFNHGQLERDFTYVDDIVDGVIRVIDKPFQEKSNTTLSKSVPPYQIYNIGNSRPVKLLYFIEALEDTLEIKAIKEMLPMQPGDVHATWADVEDLKSDFGYRPDTDVKKGVKAFVEWYKKFYGIN